MHLLSCDKKDVTMTDCWFWLIPISTYILISHIYSFTFLTAIFQVNLGYRCLLELRMMEMMVTTGLLEL